MRDIYFEAEWQELYAKRENLPLECVSFSCTYGQVEYRFLVRPIVVKGKKYPFFDIVTPYAFSGPLLMPTEDTPENKKLLAEQFDAYFDKYCRKKGIVAEFVQFSPWEKNDEPFKELYQLDYRSKIVGIDLTKKDLMTDELNARRRRSVRSGQKQGVEVIFDYNGERIDDFLRLYQFTIDKYDVIDYYRFSREFIAELFEKLKGKVCFACGMYKGKCVSICLLLESDKYLHYYLAGHDPEFLYTNANSLVIYTAAVKAQQEGRKTFVLGGAEGNLLEFKQSFTRDCCFNYYSGQRIRNPEVYDMLTQINNVPETEYFPAYRDNGKVQYLKKVPDEEK